MVNEEKLELKTNPTVREIWKLGKFILNKFFENMQKNQKLPIELLLWTTSGDWKSIQDGDYANNFIKVIDNCINLLCNKYCNYQFCFVLIDYS